MGKMQPIQYFVMVAAGELFVHGNNIREEIVTVQNDTVIFKGEEQLKRETGKVFPTK